MPRTPCPWSYEQTGWWMAYVSGRKVNQPLADVVRLRQARAGPILATFSDWLDEQRRRPDAWAICHARTN